MKLASYTSQQKGMKGWFNKVIKWRLSGPYSHNEIVFEPGDGVEDLMPDGKLEPDENGALWCGSASGSDIIPAGSKRRVGKMGGLRLKRVVLHPEKWDIIPCPRDPRKAALYFIENSGIMYAWERILGFIAWPTKFLFGARTTPRVVCYEACGNAIGIKEADRLDCMSIHYVVAAMNDG